MRVYNSNDVTKSGDEAHAKKMLNLLHTIEPQETRHCPWVLYPAQPNIVERARLEGMRRCNLRPQDNTWVLYPAHDPQSTTKRTRASLVVLARLWQICKNEGLRRYLQIRTVQAVERALQVYALLGRLIG